MAEIETYPWDPAEDLHDHADCIAYLNAALEEDDAVLVAKILDDIARAKGMPKLADASGEPGQTLFDSLPSGGSPDFDMILSALNALGLSLYAGPRREAAQSDADEELVDATHDAQPVSD